MSAVDSRPTPTAEQPVRERPRSPSRALARLSLGTASALLDAASAATRRLPARLRYLPADALTVPFGLLPSRVRTAASHNYAIVLGTSPRDPIAVSLARASIRNYGRMAMDFLASRTEMPERVRARATVIGDHYFFDALNARRGVILAMPHVGSWDVSAVIAEAYGVKLTVVTEGGWAAQLVAGARTDHGVELVPRDHSVRALFRALARQEVVVLLSDVANDGVPTLDVPFFGHPAPFPVGPARLALRTRAPIVVAFAVRQPDNTYHVEALPALSAPCPTSESDAVAQLTAAIAAAFERIISAHPEQWYPFHPIWPGAPWPVNSLQSDGQEPGGMTSPESTTT